MTGREEFAENAIENQIIKKIGVTVDDVSDFRKNFRKKHFLLLMLQLDIRRIMSASVIQMAMCQQKPEFVPML